MSFFKTNYINSARKQGLGRIAEMEAAAKASAISDAANAPNGYAGSIRNQEAPQMDLMSQLRMFQQYKGLENKQGQQPQSTNPYQQMQDSRYQQALSQPQVTQPQHQAIPYFNPHQANGLGNFGADGVYAGPRITDGSAGIAGSAGQPTQGNSGGK